MPDLRLLIAAFGSDRSRYQSAGQIQCRSGIAPVTRSSGKSLVVRKRIACPKFLRQTFHEFADHARKWSPWAKAFYAMKRAAGFQHHAAVRALAFKWIRIIYRLWTTNTTYSKATYVQQLKSKTAPSSSSCKSEKLSENRLAKTSDVYGSLLGALRELAVQTRPRRSHCRRKPPGAPTGWMGSRKRPHEKRGAR